jgi:hypothetical protein
MIFFIGLILAAPFRFDGEFVVDIFVGVIFVLIDVLGNIS